MTNSYKIDAYIIDGSLFCYDCAENIGMSFVERHIKINKLECKQCTPNYLADTYLRLLNAEREKNKK